MFKKAIIMIFFTGLFSMNSSNNFFKENFNLKNMALSDSYRYLIAKKDILLFIKKKTLDKTQKNSNTEYLSNNYSKLCYALYNGNSNLIADKRESKVCLKYSVLQGYYSGAKYLSQISFKENKIVDSIYWAGIAAGYGIDVSELEIYKKHISTSQEFKKVFLFATKDSVNLSMKYYIANKEQEPLDIYDFDYKSNKNDHIFIYEKLKSGDFEKMAVTLSNSIDDAQKLILLSHIKNEDWESLMQYCKNYFNKSINQYCLKSLNKFTKEKTPLVRYSLNEFNKYKENKMKTKSLKNAAKTLGYGFEKNNQYSKLAFDMLVSELTDKEIINTITYFNNGREIYRNKRKSK